MPRWREEAEQIEAAGIRWERDELKLQVDLLRTALDEAIDYIDPTTDPWLHVTAGEMVRRLRAYR